MKRWRVGGVLVSLVVVATVLMGVPAGAVAVLPVAFELDRQAAVSPDPGEHPTVGHLTQFQLGGTSLPADLRVAPFSAQFVQVVGVMSRVSWNGGPTDPLEVCAYVSQTNAEAVRAFLRTHAPARYPLRFAFTAAAPAGLQLLNSKLNPALPAVPRLWGPAALGFVLPGANPESC